MAVIYYADVTHHGRIRKKTKTREEASQKTKKTPWKNFHKSSDTWLLETLKKVMDHNGYDRHVQNHEG